MFAHVKRHVVADRLQIDAVCCLPIAIVPTIRNRPFIARFERSALAAWCCKSRLAAHVNVAMEIAIVVLARLLGALHRPLVLAGGLNRTWPLGIVVVFEERNHGAWILVHKKDQAETPSRLCLARARFPPCLRWLSVPQ